MKFSSIHLVGVLLLVSFMGCKKPVNVLVVLGGHSFDTTEFFDLFNSLEGINMDSVYYPDAMEVLRSGESDAYDVLVFYDYMTDLPEADSTVFLNLISAGKPLLFLHHALCSFQLWDGYMEILGGKYVMAGPGIDPGDVSDYKHDIDMEIEVVDSRHPVTLGMKDFTIHDEAYSNITLTSDITPLLKTDHPDCSPTLGWTRTQGQSTVVYLMLGHNKLAYKNPSFAQLLEQSIFWLAKQ
jgi:type 1 glutamine amidotransferase